MKGEIGFLIRGCNEVELETELQTFDCFRGCCWLETGLECGPASGRDSWRHTKLQRDNRNLLGQSCELGIS